MLTISTATLIAGCCMTCSELIDPMSTAITSVLHSAAVNGRIADPEPVGMTGSSVDRATRDGNPVLPGWYADPEVAFFPEGVTTKEPGATFDPFWIFPTYSAPYDEQLFFDAFSSPDLVHWTKHPRVLTKESVSWARRAMWAPSVVRNVHDGRYYFFFGANDIQSNEELGGIGVAVADHPAGPYRDHLGEPLIDRFHNGAQPIDQFVFLDPADGQYYLIYGGWRHCNIARLADDFTGFEPFEKPMRTDVDPRDADMKTDSVEDAPVIFREITPEGYVEGPFMFVRNGKYYFMWSEGGWTGPNYSVAYAIADSPLGPFERIGKILQQDPEVATGAGHHSVLHIPDTDDYYIVYHRRPLGETNGNHRVVCIDRMTFDENGKINPVKITFEGVDAVQWPPAPADQNSPPKP